MRQDFFGQSICGGTLQAHHLFELPNPNSIFIFNGSPEVDDFIIMMPAPLGKKGYDK